LAPKTKTRQLALPGFLWLAMGRVGGCPMP